jgi:hypothetical protein
MGSDGLSFESWSGCAVVWVVVVVVLVDGFSLAGAMHV